MNGITEAFNKALGAQPDALIGDDGAGLLAELVNKPAKPAKRAMQRVLSADGAVAVDIAVCLAEQIAAQEQHEHNCLSDIQGCAFTEGDIPLIVKAFKDSLDQEGYKGSAQRASDLKIVLLAMMKWGFVSGDGLQASAKQARELAKKMGHIKPRQAKDKGEPSNGKLLGVFTMPEEEASEGSGTLSFSEFYNHTKKAKEFLLYRFDWDDYPVAMELFNQLLEVEAKSYALPEKA